MCTQVFLDHPQDGSIGSIARCRPQQTCSYPPLRNRNCMHHSCHQVFYAILCTCSHAQQISLLEIPSTWVGPEADELAAVTAENERIQVNEFDAPHYLYVVVNLLIHFSLLQHVWYSLFPGSSRPTRGLSGGSGGPAHADSGLRAQEQGRAGHRSTHMRFQRASVDIRPE